ncbi:hypothetical protein FNF31_00292 [Cafeteria roenbergensis]|uniref:Uncharacterized protein n=1 Tax=Cafeteria roenbergensis TaxID=33653 RepID=A0A5A8DX61_CAFRO|nr:hypothetical protein FNF31_00292 [Cafeteria roenbergensis]
MAALARAAFTGTALVLLARGAAAAQSARQDSIAPDFAASVTFQTHSYNDLGLWPQMLRKGTTIWTKLDPHWLPAEQCATQTRVDNRTDPRGCFVLSHDTPDVGRRQYNSTDDVARILASPALRAFFADPDPQRKRRVAMCFKSSPGRCDATAASAGWRSLVTDTLAKLKRSIDQHGLNVEVLLDGDAAPNLPCLAQLWRPHNSTYISGGDPAGAFFSDSNVTAAWDRFLVLNEQQLVFPVAAALSWGKFAGQEQYPFLVWEPSDQPTIESLIDTYFSVGKPHLPAGMRFAINVDPVQLRVYAASRTGTAWSANVLPALSAPPMAVTVRSPAQPPAAPSPTPLPMPEAPGMPASGQTVLTFAAAGTPPTAVFSANEAAALGSPGAPFAAATDLPADPSWADQGAAAAASAASVVQLGQGSPDTLGGGGAGAAALLQTHVGSGADVAAAWAPVGGGRWGVLVADVHTDGFCQNSEVHNKQPVPSTCQLAQVGLSSTPSVLNYNTAPFDAWAAQARGQDAAGRMQTPCSNSVLAGALGMGGKPHASIAVGRAAPARGDAPGMAAAIVVAHQGLPAGSKDTGGCGIARQMDGVVVDGFALPPTAFE